VPPKANLFTLLGLTADLFIGLDYTFYSNFAARLKLYQCVVTCIIVCTILCFRSIQSADNATNEYRFTINVCAIGINGLLSLMLYHSQNEKIDDVKLPFYYIFGSNAAFMAEIPQILMERHFLWQKKKIS
jgi:hypothetical protein